MKSLTLLVFAFIVSFTTASVFSAEVKPEEKATTQNTQTEKMLSPKIKSVLDSEIKKLTKLVNNPVIISTTQANNIAHRSYSSEKIKSLDDAWINEKGINDFMLKLMTNPCAKILIKFQKEYPEFVEIFITDRFGLNSCQTNKTTDYYQADEKWWQDTYANEQGKIHYGTIEFDESAQTVSIPLYIPIRNKNGKVIGISKTILDVNYLKTKI